MYEHIKLVVLSATVMACLNLQSAEITKASSGTALNQGGSWTGGTAPGTSDVGLWSSTSSSLRSGLSLGSDLFWSGIKVSGAGGVSIAAGNTLSLGGNGINISIGSGSALTLSHALSLVADQTWTIGGSTGLGLNGALSGNNRTITVVSGGSGSYVNLYGSAANFSGTINYGAASRLNLRGTFAGTSVVLNLTAARAVYADSTIGTVVIGDLATSLSGSILGADAQNGAVTYEIGAVGNSSTWAGSIRNGGADLSKTTSLRKVGSGTWSLSGTNTYTGTTIIDNGAIRVLSAVSQLGTNTAAIVTINTLNGVQFGSGLTSFTLFGLAGSSAGSVVLTNDLGSSVDLTVNQASDTTFSGTLAGSGSLIKSGSGSLTLATASSLSGGVTINDGILTLPAAINNSIGGGILTLIGGQVNLGYNSIYSNAINVLGTATMRGSANNYALSGALTGGGTLTLTRANSGVIWFTGNVGSFTGTLMCDGAGFPDAGNSFGPNGNGITWSNATVVLRNGARFRGVTGGTVRLGAITGEAGTALGGATGGTFEVGCLNANNIFNGLIADYGTNITTLAKVGTGKFELTTNNTYTGSTTISEGTLVLSGYGSISASTNLILGRNATLDVAGLATPSFALGASQKLVCNGTNVTINGSVNLNVGSLALAYTNGQPTLTVASGTLNFIRNDVTVTVSGATLSVGSYKLVAVGVGGAVTGTLPAMVTVNGSGIVVGATNWLAVFNNELYLVVTNPPLVAASMTVTRTAGLQMLIAMSDIATNWSGNNPLLTGINLTTTNSVTLQTNTAFILYPGTAPNFNDQISYTIADNSGVTKTGVINVLVNTSVTSTNSIMSYIFGSSSNVVTAYGIPDLNYILERSTNLTAWVNVSTNTAASNGIIRVADYFSDLGGTAPSPGFYRIKWQP